MYRNFALKSRRLSESSKLFQVYNSNGTSQCNMQSVEFNKNEVTSLHQQIIDLNKKIKDLEKTNSLKDVHLEAVQRDYERVTHELTKQKRCNRNLKQQLEDERFFFHKEKEHFLHEMQNHRIKCAGSTSKLHLQQQRKLERIQLDLEQENKDLQNELIEKIEIARNLCIKLLRMKDARNTMKRRLDRLWQDHLHVMAEMMEKLDEAREELNIIVSEKFRDPLPLSKTKYLQVVQRNSRMVYENAALKLHMQQLTQNFEKLKSQSHDKSIINVDTRTIEKLTACERKKRNETVLKAQSTPRCSDHPRDDLRLERIKLQSREFRYIPGKVGNNARSELNTRSRSAPDIVHTANGTQDLCIVKVESESSKQSSIEMQNTSNNNRDMK